MANIYDYEFPTYQEAADLITHLAGLLESRIGPHDATGNFSDSDSIEHEALASAEDFTKRVDAFLGDITEMELCYRMPE